MSVRSVISGFVLAVAAVTASAIEATAECVPAIGAVPSLQGEAQVQEGAAGIWRRAALNEQLCPGDIIHVGERSRAEVTITGQLNVRLDQNTALHLPGDDQPLVVKLLYGAAYFFSRDPRRLTVDTPFVDAAVEGTEFLVKVEAERALIVVFEGRVRASNPPGELAIGDGEAAVAEAGQAPAPYLIVRPRDAVQWTLFYPAILPALADPSGAAAQELPEPLRGAIQQAAAGRMPAAFAHFDAIPETERGSDYYLYRAATLLSVGRVEDARADIGQALLRDPRDGRADALSAVIAVAQNDPERALAEAQRAVELSPQSAAARIALSYAEQARFRIEAARQALEQAVKDEPENALAWARLSELWLMQGRRDRSRRAAKRALELAPELARVQTVLGFTELAEINTGRAKKAFRRAIDSDSANPLPRFGLGLATIRAGDLEGGRKEIEIAVALDPENALLRSYLGKAYFDERTTNPLTYFQELVNNFPTQENTLAAEQFAISKELDRNDPTPWLYDAIRLQSENRPVEALRNIEKSIELNDNRAVYRSRELLDEDRAARGASLARIYNDLGFEQLGINEATKSLSYDPANAGAHRFLSDVYQTQPRREIARVSELLQAQLLQDININPVQASLSETNLGIITSGGGPARPGFNEFTPLFERNQAQLNLSGIVGNQGTYGDEAVVSGIYDNVSVSAGQFHYQSDGFRKNFDLHHNIYNLYAQAAVTPEINIQGEFRRRRSEWGDLDLTFDPDVFQPTLANNFDEDTARVGLRFSPSSRSNAIASLVYSKSNQESQTPARLPVPIGGPLEGTFDFRANETGLQGEAQYLFRSEHANITAGLGAYDIDTRRNAFFRTFASKTQLATARNSSAQERKGYVYSHINYPSNLRWTLGLSYDDYEQAALGFAELNPKFGAEWSINENLCLSVALFRTIKPALLANQTIEPTQVAGFNQLFDDQNGTKSWQFGIRVDSQLTNTLYAGANVSKRNPQEPVNETGKTESSDEIIYQGYFYWTPSREWALGVQPQFDSLEKKRGVFLTNLDTLSVPVMARYFDSSGFFGGIGGNVVYQRVKRPQNSELAEGSNNFFVVDATVGWRLPERRGLVSLEARNLLNDSFKYQDDNFRTFGTRSVVSPFLPERTIVVRLTISL